MSRISPGTILLGIVAIMFGLLGAYIARQQFAAKATNAEETVKPEPVTVPVASIDLKAGRELTMGDIALLKLTREQMKKQGINKAFMSNTQQIMGRVLRQNLARGSTFDTSSFYAEGTGPSVAERLKPGLRAVTVSVAMGSAVAGLMDVGSWVDVLFRGEADSENELPETTITLLRGVQVLALDQETQVGSRSEPPLGAREQNTSVTLGVTPSQAAALKVVEDRGTLTLALRHPEDDLDEVEGNAPSTLEDLIDRTVKTTTKHEMEIYRGRRLTTTEFKQDGRNAQTENDINSDAEEPAEIRQRLESVSTLRTDP